MSPNSLLLVRMKLKDNMGQIANMSQKEYIVLSVSFKMERGGMKESSSLPFPNYGFRE
jgi:hypothetical protein